MEIQKLGASFFRMVSPKGKVIVVDPWITGNPMCPTDWKDLSKWEDVDVLLITHGHFDHTLGIDEITKASSKVKILAVWELALSLLFKGKSNVQPVGKGGSITIDGITYSTVNAAHTSSFSDLEKGHTEFLGTAVGYVITFEDGFRTYIAGDTGLTADMKFVIGDFFKPDLAVLPVCGLMCMSPEQAVYAVEAIGCKYVIPCHDNVKPEEAPDKEGLTALIKQFPFIELMIGKSSEFEELMKKTHPEVKTYVLGLGQSIKID